MKRALFQIAVVAVLLLMIERSASAYADPGAGALMWQLAAATIMGVIFHLRRIGNWIRSRSLRLDQRCLGFLFATFYAVSATFLTLGVFVRHPLPRFADIYVIGILMTAYLFSWVPAVCLFVFSLLLSAYVLPPFGSLRVDNPADLYRLFSYSVLSLSLLWTIHRLRTKASAENGLPRKLSASFGD